MTLGHGAGPMQGSYLYAMLRVACRPEAKPFGVYLVKIDPTVRTRLYEILAAGAKTVNIYNYGPSYASVDDWSEDVSQYPNFMEVLAEFGRIDTDLEATTRRCADVALLYNRTAGIWESHDDTENSWEADAQFIYWALCHNGYNVDVVPEEDIENGVLKNYKVLYINGTYIRQATAYAI